MTDERTDERKWPYELFGVECGPGWAGLYQPLIDLCNIYNVKIGQIKEKFGGLRFYTLEADPRLDQLIAAAENASEHTCENCGLNTVAMNYPRLVHHAYPKGITLMRDGTWSGWIKTYCDPCRDKLKNAQPEPTT